MGCESLNLCDYHKVITFYWYSVSSITSAEFYFMFNSCRGVNWLTQRMQLVPYFLNAHKSNTMFPLSCEDLWLLNLCYLLKDRWSSPATGIGIKLQIRMLHSKHTDTHTHTTVYSMNANTNEHTTWFIPCVCQSQCVPVTQCPRLRPGKARFSLPANQSF